MSSVTLAQFRTYSRQRADMENSTFVSDSELNRYINASITELYDLLIQNRGENYYITSYSFTTATDTDTYPLPSGMLKLMGVDYVTSSNQAYSLRAFEWQERNRLREPYYYNAYANLVYQLRGSNIVFAPVPKGNVTMKLWYIPAFTPLSGDSDSFDGINGWEEYVIIDAAIKMCVKEETSVDALLLAKQDMKARIAAACAGRNSAEPHRVVDLDQAYSRNWMW